MCGNPLAALGCQLVEGVLYVSKLPVTADGKVSASAPEHAHVGMSATSEVGHVGQEAARKLPPKGPQGRGLSENLLWLITTSKERPRWLLETRL